jgi:hypothetical protein
VWSPKEGAEACINHMAAEKRKIWIVALVASPTEGIHEIWYYEPKYFTQMLLTA